MSDSYDSDFEFEDESIGATVDTREKQAANAYAKFRGAFGGTEKPILRSNTVATQTDDSWLPNLIKKIETRKIQN